MMRHPAKFAAALLGVYVTVAWVAAALMPYPRTTFEYLVAGALATGVCLILAFVLYFKSKAVPAERNGDPT